MNFRRLMLAALLLAALAPSRVLTDSLDTRLAPARISPVAPPQARPFPLSDVRVLDGLFKTSQDIAIRYLLSLEPDRFLANFRQEAGLAPKAEHYTGWERQGVSGHSAGHYLSACAQAYAATGDNRFLERVNYLVGELAVCQQAHGDGYVAAIPKGRQVYAEVARGEIRSAGFDLNGCWVPNYTMHKVFAGLRDAWRLAGSAQALEVGRRLADWFERTHAGLSEAQMQKVLACEHGGLNETFADLYADTGDARYLALARRFHHQAILDPLARGEDILPGKHANTQIPKLTGLATLYELTGQATDKAAAAFFWDRVVNHHSYVTGGHCNHEHFGPPDQLNDRLSPSTTETCNVYNMLKLTRHVFGWSPTAQVADFYERALLNHMRGTQHPDGRVIYNLSLQPGHHKEYQALYDGFTCCMGTGMENHVRYGEGIYFHDAQGLWVNLFVASELQWRERGIKVRQETRFPYADTTRVGLQMRTSQTFTIRLRHPHWAKDGIRVSVNGQRQSITTRPSSYAEIRREWKDGDRIEIAFPMSLRTESMPDNPRRVAVFYGPTLLAAKLGPVSDSAATDPGYVPVLVTDDRPVSRWVKSVSARNITFKTDGVGRPRDVELVPFFALHDWRYTVYLDLLTAPEWAVRETDLMAQRKRDQELAARTADVLRIGEMQPERDHQLASEKSNAGEAFGRRYRHATDGGWFSFVMKLPAGQPAALVLTYWGSDSGGREFDVLIDGEKIATQKLENNRPNQFFDVTHPIPERLRQDKTSVTVRLQAHEGKTAGGLFGARMVKSTGSSPESAPTPATTTTAVTNLVPNASFETVRDGRPRGWSEQRFGGQATFTHANTGRTGSRSLQITSTSGADAGWQATVRVEPFTRYRLTGWIKTLDVRVQGGRGASINLHDHQPTATQPITGTTDWTRVEATFDVDDQDSLQVNCLLGGWGMATGTAWFDDLQLEPIGQRPVPAPSIKIDAADVRAPMSPRIYSQFIEHLGRCIYGGIWAEMLEDRKFYYPITSDYSPYRSLRDSAYPVVGASPWQIMGPSEGVRMTTNQPFVGRHTPSLAAGSGIRQRDLGLAQGKEYAGYIWLKSSSNDAGKADVTLRWGEGPQDHQTVKLSSSGQDYQRLTFRFTAGATTDKAMLEVQCQGGSVLVGTLSLMPADNIEGLRADTLALLKELKAPIYRWPGGNFVSGYDWRDGVGDRDRRPPRTNPAWTGVEHNDFGMHEFIRFCQLVETEPWITVNTGFGDAYSAAAQLEYCNGSVSTLWGKRRADHGAVEPFGVKYWGIGNEMWGNWQLGFMQLHHYVLKHNWVVDKMREVDPDIIEIGSGDIGTWSTGLLKSCANHMDFIAEHYYCQERPSLAAHVRQIPTQIKRKADFHRQARKDLPELKGKDIRIAMTEWNYWYGPHVFGELGTRYFLKDGLGIAAGLHEYARQSDIIDSAFYAQTVNVIGCIKTSRRAAAFETTGLVLKLYRQQFGEFPVATTTTGLVDAQAAWSQDRKRLTIGVVNPTLQEAQVPVQLQGARLRADGRRWQIAGKDPMVYNDPDQPPRVIIEEDPARWSDRLVLPPCSVTLWVFEVE